MDQGNSDQNNQNTSNPFGTPPANPTAPSNDLGGVFGNSNATSQPSNFGTDSASPSPLSQTPDSSFAASTVSTDQASTAPLAGSPLAAPTPSLEQPAFSSTPVAPASADLSLNTPAPDAGSVWGTPTTPAENTAAVNPSPAPISQEASVSIPPVQEPSNIASAPAPVESAPTPMEPAPTPFNPFASSEGMPAPVASAPAETAPESTPTDLSNLVSPSETASYIPQSETQAPAATAPEPLVVPSPSTTGNEAVQSSSTPGGAGGFPKSTLR